MPLRIRSRRAVAGTFRLAVLMAAVSLQTQLCLSFISSAPSMLPRSRIQKLQDDLRIYGRIRRSEAPLYGIATERFPSSLAAAATTTPHPKSPRPSSHRDKQPNKKKYISYQNQNQRGPLTKRQVRKLFFSAKALEKQGRWQKAIQILEDILKHVPDDAHSHLALARLQARRELKLQKASDSNNSTLIKNSRARETFRNASLACPTNVHILQAWAIFESSGGNYDQARQLYQKALSIESTNTHVCHAYGLMEKKLGNLRRAKELFEIGLQNEKATAALICSLGEIHIAEKDYSAAQDLYRHQLSRLEKTQSSEKDHTEVLLASAWLEERYFRNYDRARELIDEALTISPGSSLASVALARFESRMERRSETSTVEFRTGKRGFSKRDQQKTVSGKKGSANEATRQRLAKACLELQQGIQSPSNPDDGRLFNTWASLEIQERNYTAARSILEIGRTVYPTDMSLLQAAGQVEERVGNYTGARHFYSESLQLEPSAPTLVAVAMLELSKPLSGNVNYSFVKQLFEEALLLDPQHGPAYNAYGRAESQYGAIQEAREIFQRGVQADCHDAASLYHGYGILELSTGNIDHAREIFQQGMTQVRQWDASIGTDSTRRGRCKYLCHSYGMLELNSGRPADALDIFKEGLSRCGNSSQLLLGAALCEVKLGKEQAARDLFEQSVLADNRHAQAWQAWGVMETRAGDFFTAKTLFEAGLKSCPKHGALWHAYASLEQKKGKYEQARNLYSKGIKKARNHAPLYQGWASLELRQGNHEAARKLITRALTIDKSNGPGWLIAANIEREVGNDGLQLLLLRRGIECAPDDPSLYRRLGEYLIHKGQMDDAREVLEQGIQVNPLHAPLYHSLAELEARVFNVQGLADLNKRTTAIFSNNAMEPSSASTSHAFGTRIRNKSTSSTGSSGSGGTSANNLPRQVAILAQKIVEEETDKQKNHQEAGNGGGGGLLASMTAYAMEDDAVGELLGVLDDDDADAAEKSENQ